MMTYLNTVRNEHVEFQPETSSACPNAPLLQIVNSALLFPCMEYQRLLHTEKVASIAENFSEYIANDPKVSFTGWPLLRL